MSFALGMPFSCAPFHVPTVFFPDQLCGSVSSHVSRVCCMYLLVEVRVYVCLWRSDAFFSFVLHLFLETRPLTDPEAHRFG